MIFKLSPVSNGINLNEFYSIMHRLKINKIDPANISQMKTFFLQYFTGFRRKVWRERVRELVRFSPRRHDIEIAKKKEQQKFNKMKMRFSRHIVKVNSRECYAMCNY